MRIIDLKHHIEIRPDANGEPQPVIVKSGNNTVIESDEPTCLFRARDYLSVPMLENYRALCVADGCNDFQLEQVDELLARFRQFAIDHPDRMKQPGRTRGM